MDDHPVFDCIFDCFSKPNPFQDNQDYKDPQSLTNCRKKHPKATRRPQGTFDMMLDP